MSADDTGRLATEQERAYRDQFMAWALPYFEVMLGQAIGQMGASVGHSAMMYAQCFGAARLAINSMVSDPKAAYLEQCEHAYAAALHWAAEESKENNAHG